MSNISVPTKVENIAEARIVPSCNCYILEIVYEAPEVELIQSEWVVRTGRYQGSHNRGKLHVKNISY
ncbi:MAG: hypothetical protein RID53_06125 [Coleofasciculus sp. B1-GNL1-01]|uniref:hypothetical protein n=1 Tax=Coleofasciculus sp. B1-GNL1-01 TaxID=3068484 RepID=UPI0032F698FE